MRCQSCGEREAVYSAFKDFSRQRSIVLCEVCAKKANVKSCGNCGNGYYQKMTSLSEMLVQYKGTELERYIQRGAAIWGKSSCYCPKCLLDLLQHIVRRNDADQTCNHCGEPEVTVEWNDDYSELLLRATGIRLQMLGRMKFCQVCFPLYGLCPRCGRAARTGSIYPGGLGCTGCFEDFHHVVQPHNYVPREYFTFFVPKEDKKTHTFGMEFEFTLGMDANGRNRNRDIYAAALQHLVGNNGEYYFKHDGSVSPGFEVVTMPMTRQYIYESKHLPRIFEKMAELVPEIHKLVKEHQHCGFHVHLGRANISKLDTFKMGAFCYVNQKNLSVIAGREPEDVYCSGKIRKANGPGNGEGRGGARDYNFTTNTSLSAQIMEGRLDKGDRYQMFNIYGQQTVEFRFFQGITTIEGVYLGVDLVDAIRAWAEVAGVQQVSWSEFFRFVTCSGKWNYLSEFLLKREREFKDYPFTSVPNLMSTGESKKQKKAVVQGRRRNPFDRPEEIEDVPFPIPRRAPRPPRQAPEPNHLIVDELEVARAVMRNENMWNVVGNFQWNPPRRENEEDL